MHFFSIRYCEINLKDIKADKNEYKSNVNEIKREKSKHKQNVQKSALYNIILLWESRNIVIKFLMIIIH